MMHPHKKDKNLWSLPADIVLIQGIQALNTDDLERHFTHAQQLQQDSCLNMANTHTMYKTGLYTFQHG